MGIPSDDIQEIVKETSRVYFRHKLREALEYEVARHKAIMTAKKEAAYAEGESDD